LWIKFQPAGVDFVLPEIHISLISSSVAGVAELADARDSKSRSARSVGSIPTAGSFFSPQKQSFAAVSAICLIGLFVSRGFASANQK
jgi:hypothetical protein